MHLIDEPYNYLKSIIVFFGLNTFQIYERLLVEDFALGVL